MLLCIYLIFELNVIDHIFHIQKMQFYVFYGVLSAFLLRPMLGSFPPPLFFAHSWLKLFSKCISNFCFISHIPFLGKKNEFQSIQNRDCVIGWPVALQPDFQSFYAFYLNFNIKVENIFGVVNNNNVSRFSSYFHWHTHTF